MAMRTGGVVDINHPVFAPRPEKREDEEWWQYKWRIDAWARKKRKRKPMSDSTRQKVFERDGRVCLNCGSTDRLTVDHIHPWSKGGADVMDNYQTLCASCNYSKGNSIAGGEVESG